MKAGRGPVTRAWGDQVPLGSSTRRNDCSLCCCGCGRFFCEGSPSSAATPCEADDAMHSRQEASPALDRTPLFM